MRTFLAPIALLITGTALGPVGCGRSTVVEQPGDFDRVVVRETDGLPEVRRVPERVELDGLETIIVQRPVEADRSVPIVTAANRGLADVDLRYDPATEITIRDVVLGKRYVRLDPDHTGVIVELQPGGDFIDVLVGTTKYLFTADVNLQIADPVMVTGSRIVVNGRPMLLAKTLFLGNREIILRDKDNYPLWRDPNDKPNGSGD